MGSVTMNAKMTERCEVYFGPGSEATYTYVGVVGRNERVCVHWKEFGYYNITYLVDSTGKYKTGYVPASKVSLDSNTDVPDYSSEISRNMRSTYISDGDHYAFYRTVGDSDECVGSISDGDAWKLVFTAGTDNYDYPYWKYIQYTVDTTQKYKRGWVYMQSYVSIGV